MSTLKQSVKTVSAAWRNSPYYAEAEQWTWIFWESSRPFRQLFDCLNAESILELACGFGRHAERIAPQTKQLIVMDVIAENIEACRRRLAPFGNVAYHVNNGYDFQPVSDEHCTAIVCYDAMVHFSPDLVASYLKDTARILRPGGRALYHHSNYPAPLDRSYAENPHARNHMTKDQFAELSRRSGLEVVEQRVMDWGDSRDLDCLSLVQRPQ